MVCGGSCCFFLFFLLFFFVFGFSPEPWFSRMCERCYNVSTNSWVFIWIYVWIISSNGYPLIMVSIWYIHIHCHYFSLSLVLSFWFLAFGLGGLTLHPTSLKSRNKVLTHWHGKIVCLWYIYNIYIYCNIIQYNTIQYNTIYIYTYTIVFYIIQHDIYISYK